MGGARRALPGAPSVSGARAHSHLTAQSSQLPSGNQAAATGDGPIVTPSLSSLLALALAFPLVATAQSVRLDRPAASHPEVFSFVRGVRELRDGRLLVADWIEQRVVVLDFAGGSADDVVTEGGGPDEVRLPSGLVPFRGDSTLLVDQGNTRLLVLAPDGRVARTIAAEAPGRMGTRGVTADGAFLHAIPSWAEGPSALPDDSVRIVRWDPRTDRSTPVAVVQGTRWRKDRSPAMTPRLPMVGFASQDAWMVSPAGEVVIVRASPYRVEVIGVGGRRRIGPALPVTPRPVTAADKLRFVRDFAAGSPVSGRGPGGGMGRAPMPSARELAQQVETAEWATHHPPFDASGVFAAPGGRTWVARPAFPGEPVRYDVFDADGRRVQQVELGARRRVVHVGARGVYVVAETEDGEQTIERFAIP